MVATQGLSGSLSFHDGHVEAVGSIDEFVMKLAVALVCQLRRLSRRRGFHFLEAVLNALKIYLYYILLDFRGHPVPQMGAVPNVKRGGGGQSGLKRCGSFDGIFGSERVPSPKSRGER